jgi:RNA polymerase sigma-70 factor (ECF subfamily)
MIDGEVTLSISHPTYNSLAGKLLGVCVPDKPNIESEASATAVTDEGLIMCVRHGDAMAFETLVDRYQKSALLVARRCIGQRTEAEGLAQEAFLQVHRYAHQYNAEVASFKTWFFAILTNLCRNAVKRDRSLSFIELPKPEGDLAHEEERAALAAAVAKLPTNQRLALILRHYEGFSYSEAAAALGLSVQAFGSLFARAKRSLRRELTDLEKNLPTERHFFALPVY